MSSWKPGGGSLWKPPRAHTDDDGWVGRRNMTSDVPKTGASKQAPPRPPPSPVQSMEEDEDDNPFDIYKLDSPGFVIPKKRAADTPPQAPSPQPTPVVTERSAWPVKKVTKVIDMSPTLTFGTKKQVELESKTSLSPSMDSNSSLEKAEKPAKAANGGGKKKGRLKRAKDDDSSDSDSLLISPMPTSKVAPSAKRVADDDDASPVASKAKANGKKRKRVQRARGSSMGGHSDDDDEFSLTDDASAAPGAGAKGGKAAKEEVLLISSDEDKPKGVKKGKAEEMEEEEEKDDPDETETEEEDEDVMEQRRMRTHMQKILRRCEEISDRLMAELRTWTEGQGAKEDGSRRMPEDRIGLTSIVRREGEEQESDAQAGASRTARLSSEALSQICPKATLKPYQLVGVEWLYLTYQLGVSGCLADEMGLGKTVQTIVFLAYLCHVSPEQTHLIIVPASVLSNWETEFARFAPQVKILRYHGSTSERAAIRDDHQRRTRKREHLFDVILTTYTYWERDTGKEDRQFFRKMKLTYMVLDEGHSVKNLQSQRFRRLRSQPSSHRLVLSGTPVQNAVKELLVLMHFLMPEVFNFGELLESFFSFISGGSDENDQAGLLKLRRLFAPFVLRRLKADVLDQLTDKTSHVLLLPMHVAQAAVYNDIRDTHMARLVARSEEKHPSLPASTTASDSEEGKDPRSAADARRLRSLKSELAELLKASALASSADAREARNVFHDFRKAANHPLLLRRLYTGPQVAEIASVLCGAGHFGDACTPAMALKELETMNDFDINDLCDMYRVRLKKYMLDPETLYESCKFCKLRALLPELLGQGHRVLLFSQWTKILDMLEELLERLALPFLRLDGSTPINERQDLIDSFNEEGSEFGVFLLSTRAGGLGLNLTGADTVILHDSDWNPTVDRQAEDRCHRIGQTKPVTVYRLVTSGTVDERVYEIATAKLERSEVLLDKDEGAEAGGSDEEAGVAEPPLTIAALVRAELEKYLQKGQGSSSSTDTSPTKA